jgi:UDP-2,3-diacylglucosamine pyrophosphatase LpxH
MKNDFRRARHTFSISDLHLTEAEPANPKKPLWKLYKSRKFFIDASFKLFLDHIEHLSGADKNPDEKIELILNGDVFDFDSVTRLPDDPKQFNLHWLEKARGLNAEEPKSRFKMEVILQDHQGWVAALREFVLKGHRVVFIIGNHDIELHWPGVQKTIVEALNLPEILRSHVRFCEWFYISNQDTLFEHGNQYDAYSLCSNPVHPLIKKGRKIVVRTPFGDIANKLLLNGMGMLNPHVPSQYIMGFKDYTRFFFKYLVRIQPGIILTWFWSALATLFHSLVEGFLPAVKDPLTVERRIAEIAQKSNASPRTVRALKEIHVHPAHFNPIKIMQELWVDRALLFLLILLVSFQVISLVKLIADISMFWILVPIAGTMPFFVFYAQSITSKLDEEVVQAPSRSVAVSSRLAKVSRVVHGHTHYEAHRLVDGVELLNSGTWSPGFKDLECTKPYGRTPFVWIRPPAPEEVQDGARARRVAELREWKEASSSRIPMESSAEADPAEPPAQIPAESASKSG